MQDFEKGDMTANRKKFKRIKGIIPITLWNQYNNLEEIYDFLEKHKLSKLTQEEKNENTILL